MKILLVTPFYKPYLGGVERVVSELAKELVKKGHGVAILTTFYSFPRTFHKDWRKKEEIDGLEVFRLKPLPKTTLPFFSAPLTLFSPFEVRSFLRKVKPEAVIYFGDKWFLGNFLVKLLSPKKTRHLWCPVFHDLTLFKQWLRPINFLFAKMINDVAVVSGVEEEKVRKAYWLNRSNIKIIPWGVNSRFERSDYLATNPDYSIVGADRCVGPSEKNVVNILAVGRLSKHKGQLWLTEVFLEAIKKTTQKCQLTLVGSVEDVDVYDQIVKLSRPEIVVDTKADDAKLVEYYQTSDVFALFPEYESFGLVFLEAMSYGMPVLTHKVGALPEVLKEGSVLVDKYNKEQAVLEMVKLIEDTRYKEDMGNKGKKFVACTYSWERCVIEIYEIIGDNSYL